MPADPSPPLAAPAPDSASPPIRRVFIECTRTYFLGGNTGIQRVVRNVVRRSAEAGPDRGLHCEPLVFAGFGGVRPRRPLGTRAHWTARLRECAVAARGPLLAGLGAVVPKAVSRWLRGLAPGRGRLARLREALLAPLRGAAVHIAGALAFPVEALTRRAVALGPGDLLLLLDAGWGIPGLPEWVARGRAAGARVGIVLHDLIPIEHPESCSFATRSFAHWLDASLESADFVVSVSEATRLRLLLHLEEQGRAPRLPTGVFRLGAELDLAAPAGPPRADLEAALDGPGVHLAVGTIEPRKNHALLLDAFEQRWAHGSEARLVVVGKPGWGSKPIRERLRGHREAGRRLFVFEDLDDTGLARAYAGADAVVCASSAEGFGLPVVEALARGVPVIASDIPSHVEVGGKHAVYFRDGRAEDLARALADFEARGRPPEAPPLSSFRWPGWWESTVELLEEALRLASAPRPRP